MESFSRASRSIIPLIELYAASYHHRPQVGGVLTCQLSPSPPHLPTIPLAIAIVANTDPVSVSIKKDFVSVKSCTLYIGQKTHSLSRESADSASDGLINIFFTSRRMSFLLLNFLGFSP